MQAPATPPSISAMAKGTTLLQGMRPTIAWQRAMAGFMHTPPKMNRHTLMPNDQVVIANMWPESRYLLPLSVISQCTPTPKTIMRAVEANSAKRWLIMGFLSVVVSSEAIVAVVCRAGLSVAAILFGGPSR